MVDVSVEYSKLEQKNKIYGFKIHLRNATDYSYFYLNKKKKTLTVVANNKLNTNILIIRSFPAIFNHPRNIVPRIVFVILRDIRIGNIITCKLTVYLSITIILPSIIKRFKRFGLIVSTFEGDVGGLLAK